MVNHRTSELTGRLTLPAQASHFTTRETEALSKKNVSDAEKQRQRVKGWNYVLGSNMKKLSANKIFNQSFAALMEHRHLPSMKLVKPHTRRRPNTP